MGRGVRSSSGVLEANLGLASPSHSGFRSLNYVNYTVKYVLEFSVEGGSTVELHSVVWPTIAPYQEAHLVDTSHPIADTTTDEHGNQIMVLSQIQSPQPRTFNISMTYDVAIWLIDYEIDPDNIGEYDQSSGIYLKYTEAETYMESDHPKIVQKANEIVGSETNAYHAAQAIFQWVYSNIAYELQEDDMGALWALENGKGDCSEHAFLFVALCRAVGIPARHVEGPSPYLEDILHDGAFYGEKNPFHAWAEVYFPNYGWVWVDPTWGWFADNDLVHMLWQRGRWSEPMLGYTRYFYYYWGPTPSVRWILEVDVVPADADADGLTNLDEYQHGTDAFNPDSDGDRLKDGEEVTKYKTDPLNADTDNDGLNDGEEIALGTNPLNSDTDGDFWDDLFEANLSMWFIFNPTNFWLPNAVIIGGIAVATVATIFIIRRRRKVIPPTPPAITAPVCHVCGGQLTWIQQYQRWYCYNCKQYR